jgi:imidazoleglycerol phosphate synthase glutamine amidotransferase subunit HisH
MTNIVIIDCGLRYLGNFTCGLERVRESHTTSSDPASMHRTYGVVLPGVCTLFHFVMSGDLGLKMLENCLGMC